MREARWSAAAFVLLLSGAVVGLAGPAVRAADTVTMGSDAEPFALKFFPAEVTVPVGSTIKWENKGDLQHDVVAQNGSFKSPLLNKGQTFEFKFTTPGDFPYICTPHEDAGMKGVVKVVGGSAPPPAPAPAGTPTTRAAAAAAPGSSTTTTARPGQPTTTTTAAAAAANNAAGSGGTTTTTAGVADPGVTTSSGPATTPTSAPDVAGETTTTTGHGTEEAAAGGDHASRGGAEEKKKSSPLGIAFAGISTVILTGITGKLLASRS